MENLFKEPRELSVKAKTCADGRVSMTVTIEGARAELVAMFKALSQSLNEDGGLPLAKQFSVLARAPIPVDEAIRVTCRSRRATGIDCRSTVAHPCEKIKRGA